MLIVPALYISDDALLQRIADYVKQGGHVMMTFKSGFANENSAVRWVRAPGPLREAAGLSYQEFSNLEHPLSLKDDPFHAGTDNHVMYWAEFLMPEHAKALAYYDHPFFGRWPAITENQYGAGSLLYEGTYLSDGLQKAMVLRELQALGLAGPDQTLPVAVHAVHGTDRLGHHLNYYFNYSGDPVSFQYAGAAGKDLLNNAPVAPAQQITMQPWDLEIVEER
jgi:beta-galactosidase